MSGNVILETTSILLDLDGNFDSHVLAQPSLFGAIAIWISHCRALSKARASRGCRTKDFYNTIKIKSESQI